MHKYLRSIGFKKANHNNIKSIICEVIQNPDTMELAVDDKGNQMVELRKAVAPGMGLALCGSYDDEDFFAMEYYYPYLDGHEISTNSKVEIVEESDKNSYQGLCEDNRLGIDLCFYIQDMMSVIKSDQAEQDVIDFGGVKLSALATEGKIILPVVDANPSGNNIMDKKKRGELLAAAREGDGQALEKLALEDIDAYSMISKRLEKDDVLSIVKSTFMPNGLECDKYYILGEIIGYKNFVNKMSMELVHVLKVNCNDLVFDVAINGTDLLGEPEVGRRFKGNIWMQGRVYNN